MTDHELKLEIINKHLPTFPFGRKGSPALETIITCMKEWAGVISKRIDEEDAEDGKNGSYFNDKYGL